MPRRNARVPLVLSTVVAVSLALAGISVGAAGTAQSRTVRAIPTTPAAVDMFLKIDGIEGESKASGHEAWIEVLSGSWAEDGTGRRPNAPAPAGILTLVRRADRANARLTEACGSGRSLGDIVVHKRVGDQLEESAFGDARISACTTETRDGLRVETITLTYSKIDAPAPPAPARLGGNPDRPLIEGR